jgi:oligoribonuclease (3'-5' exoribonuclease)
VKSTNTLLIDCATSDLRPGAGQILEVAALLVDANLTTIDYYTSVVAAPNTTRVPGFHEPLLVECSLPGTPSLRAVEGGLLALNWEFGCICNRAIDFDLEWIAAHMPALHRTFRTKLVLDLRALEFLAMNRGAAAFTPSGPRSYRAPDDLVYAYEELCWWSVRGGGAS